jgi:predicted Zn-dependent peptidase
VRTDVTAESVKELLAELSAIAAPKPTRPIEQDELGRAQADLVHRLGAHLEQNRILTGDLASVFVHDLGKDYFARLPEVYARLGTDAVASQQSLLQVEKLTLVIVGDLEAIEPSLKKAGFSVITPEPGWTD